MPTILFLGANPNDTQRLDLGWEVREITRRLRATKFAAHFEVAQEWAVHADDIQAALLRHKPDIVYFSGHGEETRWLLVESAGRSRGVTFAAALYQALGFGETVNSAVELARNALETRTGSTRWPELEVQPPTPPQTCQRAGRAIGQRPCRMRRSRADCPRARPRAAPARPSHWPNDQR